MQKLKMQYVYCHAHAFRDDNWGEIKKIPNFKAKKEAIKINRLCLTKCCLSNCY